MLSWSRRATCHKNDHHHHHHHSLLRQQAAVCMYKNTYHKQWRRQLWGTGACAPSTSNNFIFSSLWSKSDSQLSKPSKYCVVCEIGWCRSQQLTALAISTALVTKLLVTEQLLHPAMKPAVGAPWPWAPPGFSAGGGKHRETECRGAAGAERGRVWGGGISGSGTASGREKIVYYIAKKSAL